jgi:hypothetical protein
MSKSFCQKRGGEKILSFFFLRLFLSRVLAVSLHEELKNTIKIWHLTRFFSFPLN